MVAVTGTGLCWNGTQAGPGTTTDAATPTGGPSEPNSSGHLPIRFGYLADRLSELRQSKAERDEVSLVSPEA